ncbi:glycosyltransferase [Rhodocaloribacter litoris]|uniref:cellulose synthase family protein n=1 Tax=Rhodocaloribacter litoris TaxID=2558931 RepID=UPI00142320E9|nr:cellulose synthase family protein [Rhodocaloribacter litoris]QXD15920.1 glycosyltransferase [Rhodocaloribacter litoris]
MSLLATVLAVFYAAGMAVLLVYGLNLLWMALVHARHDVLRPGPVPDPDAVPEPDDHWPVVTVQLPLYNEAFVAERLIDACARLRYPRRRLEIQVLDDSTDHTTALVARRVRTWRARGLDILHIHRTDRAGFKAGALQNGLRLARGELVAVFDADFIPPPDFLLRTVPAFEDERVGLVQARWGHLNDDASLLTRMQAFGLDTHFAVEQHVRSLAGCFINFNGTAGVWRAACIEDAGGWQSDTLTEDLDLSYRAQLRGWQCRYLPDVEVPAELPVDINAFRTQQFRWTKGAVQTARKLLGPLWRSDLPAGVKLEGTLHLTAHSVFPFVALVAVLHAPLLGLSDRGYGPGATFFAVMGLGLLGFAGFFLAQLFAQRALYPDWPRRLLRFPLFMAGSMGLALNNSRALIQALRGKTSVFVRTPKYAVRRHRPARAWWRTPYAESRIPPLVWLELLLALYCLAGLVLLLLQGAWAAAPFQAFFALGFGLVAGFNLHQFFLSRTVPPGPA